MTPLFDNINTPRNTERINDAAYIYARYDAQKENKMDTKQITTLVVAVTVCLSFLAVVVAPFVNVIIPQTTQTFVFGLFSAMLGAGGVLGVTQAATASTMRAMGK